MPVYKGSTPLIAYDGFTESGDFKHVPIEQLKVLDGLQYDEEDFVASMEEPLSLLVTKSSGIRLSLGEGNGLLTAVTQFETARELNEQELAQLKAEYDGQMSDGIGENLLSELKNRSDVPFKLDVYGLYEDTMGSGLKMVT